MKKKLLGRLMGLTLSAVLAVSSVSAPAYAAELEPELTESETFLEEENEELPEVLEEEEFTEEEAPAEEEEAPAEEEEVPGEEDETPTEEEDVPVEAEEEIPVEEEAPLQEEKSPEVTAGSEDESKGLYYLKFNAGVPEGCIQPHIWGYYDGEIVPAEIGATIVLSGDEFEIPGYDLVGWTYTDAKGKEVKLNTPEATIASLTDKEGETFEFTPVWKLGTYTVTYDFNGGTSTAKNTYTYQLSEKTVETQPLYNYVKNEDGSFVINEKNPEVTREGYIFTGWDGHYSDVRYYGGTTFRNMELVAQWKGITYPLRWDGNGGTVYENDVYTYTTTLDGGFSSFKAERPGYTHQGWIGKVKGKDKFYKLSDIVWVKELDRDEDGGFTLIASWTPNKNTITYHLNSGKIAKAPKTFLTGDGTVIPNPVRDYAKFMGWKVNEHYEDGTSYDYPYAEVLGYIKNGKLTEAADHDLELVADFKDLTYKITFKNSDGSDLIDDEGKPVEYPILNYWDDMEFTSAAWMIESSGALPENVSVAGFALTPNAKKPKYKLNTNYTNIFPKSYDGEGTEVPLTFYVVPQEKVYRISYETAGGTVKKAVYSFTEKKAKKELPIKAVASKTGFTFVGWTTYEQFEEYVVRDKKGYVKAIKAGTDTNIFLEAVYDKENTYTITIMPGAADVKDAEGKPVNKKTGIQFKAGDVTTFRYSDEETFIADYVNGWTREGYEFMCFSKDPKGKNSAFFAGGLGNGKSKNVKIYACWVPKMQNITLSDQGLVYRGDGSYLIADEYIEAPLYNELAFAYGSKDYAPPKLSAVGYNFLGWRVDGSLSDDSGIQYTDASRKYVKKIKKTNKEDIKLQAVFSEISYKIYVNPNGGEYKGSKAKTLVSDKVFYGQQTKDEYFDIVNNTKRVGYRFQFVSTTMNYKGDVRQTIWDQSGKNNYFYRNRLAEKQGAEVVLNVLWTKVDPSTPKMDKQSIHIDGDTLYLQSSHNPSQGYSRIVFEYSTTSDFSKNVKTCVWDELEKDENFYPVYPTVKVAPGKSYYVRVRSEILDSTGDYFPGEWSKPVMATITSFD